MRFAAALICLPGLALAETASDIADILGGYGCTLDAVSRAAVAEAGISDLEPAISTMLSDGRAMQQGDYVVLSADNCTIRLPNIQSAVTVDSPVLSAVISAPDAYVDEEYPDFSYPGCFLVDPLRVFTVLNPTDPAAAHRSYMEFLGNGLIAGDLRFFENTLLATPPGFQVTTGACGNVPGIEQLDPSRAYMNDASFDDFIRQVGALTPCDGSNWTDQAGGIALVLQGADETAGYEFAESINANLSFEYQMIAMGAGWFGDTSSRNTVTLRPPVCHYP